MLDGAPDAVKVACPVLAGGKAGDNIKGLPIGTPCLYQDGERCFKIRQRPDCQHQRGGQGGGSLLDQIGDTSVLRPDCLYHLRGAGGGPEHEHAGGDDKQHGGAGGRRILQERRGLHVRRPRQEEPPALRRAPVCQIQAGQRQDGEKHTYFMRRKTGSV